MQIFFPFLSSKHDQGFIRFPRYLPFSRLDVFLRRFRRLSLGSAAICDDWALISLDYAGTEGSELMHRRKILNLLALRKQKNFFSSDLSFISQHYLLCFYFIFCLTCEMFEDFFSSSFFHKHYFPNGFGFHSNQENILKTSEKYCIQCCLQWKRQHCVLCENG